jgi:hypothetical protein
MGTRGMRHAATSLLLGAVVAGVVVGAGCGTGTSKVASLRRASAAPAAKPPAGPVPGFTPMVLDTAVPASRPPSVTLVVQSGRHQVSIRGVPFVTQWATPKGVVVSHGHYPVPWPAATAIGSVPGPALVFDSPDQPDYLIIKEYSHLDPVSRTPNPLPDAIYECTRFQAVHCNLSTSHSGTRAVGFSPNLFIGGYFIVFGIWHVPFAAQTIKTGLMDDDAGSWLFHVDDLHSAGAAAR